MSKTFMKVLNYFIQDIVLKYKYENPFLVRHIMGLDQKNMSFGVCEQQRYRPACAYAQTDQCLCYSLFGKYHIRKCFKVGMPNLA